MSTFRAFRESHAALIESARVMRSAEALSHDRWSIGRAQGYSARCLKAAAEQRKLYAQRKRFEKNLNIISKEPNQ